MRSWRHEVASARGYVRHRRARPTTYELEHGVYYFAIDLEELDESIDGSASSAGVGGNIVSFRDDDHLSPPATDLATGSSDHLRARRDRCRRMAVTLVTNLRVLGYVFNPASFFLCRDDGGALRVVVVEVHNTYGERHLYTLRRVGDGRPVRVGRWTRRSSCRRSSRWTGGYAVHVRDDDDGLRIAIAERQDGAPLLSTSLVLRRVPLTDRNVLRMLLRHPLVPHKTIALIHWHALRLWLRGVPFLHHRAAATERRSLDDAALGRTPR